jgi:hypothetical protein
MGTPSQASSGAICTKVQLQGHLSISGTEENGSNTATEFYIIKWSGHATTEDCRGCTDGTITVPVRSTAHYANAALDARRIEIRPAENNSRTIFSARVEFSDDFTTPANPLDTPPDIQWDIGEDGQIPYFLDNSGTGENGSGGTITGKNAAGGTISSPQATLNSAAMRFADFLQRYGGTVTATFAVNIPLTGTYNGSGGVKNAWNVSQAIIYCAGGSNQSTPAINSDSFTFDGQTISIGQCRIKGMKCGSVQTQNGVKYRVKMFSLAFKKSWLDVIDDRGFYEIDPARSGQVREILNPVGGTKPDTPWPLDGSGAKKPNATDAAPQWTFVPYRSLPFATLGFS